MKELFGKGFGFIFGIYAAFVATNVVDSKLPDEYKVYSNKTTTSDSKTEEAQ